MCRYRNGKSIIAHHRRDRKIPEADFSMFSIFVVVIRDFRSVIIINNFIDERKKPNSRCESTSPYKFNDQFFLGRYNDRITD